MLGGSDRGNAISLSLSSFLSLDRHAPAPSLGPFSPRPPTRIDITTLDPCLHTQSQHHPELDSKRKKSHTKNNLSPPLFYSYHITSTYYHVYLFGPIESFRHRRRLGLWSVLRRKVSSFLCEVANTVVSSRSPSRSHSSLRVVLNLRRPCLLL